MRALAASELPAPRPGRAAAPQPDELGAGRGGATFAECENLPRIPSTTTPDLRQPGKLRHHQARAGADRSATPASRDRCDHRRGYAQRQPAIWRSVLPEEQQCRCSEQLDSAQYARSPPRQRVLNRVLPGFNFLVGTEAQPQVIINALHAVTDVKILSNPSLVVVDNQAATLQVGDQIPITTQSAQSVIAPGAPVVNNIDYRNTGIILRVAPRINANGNVLLNIEQEISSVADNINATSLTPTVSQRRVASSIAVASGQTVLLAGLVSKRKTAPATAFRSLDQDPRRR